MSRFLLLLLLTCGLTTAVRAQTDASAEDATVAATPVSNDPWLDMLEAMLVQRYRTTGELQLSWNRPRPADAAKSADLVLLDAPSELAPQILVTVRALSDAGVASEHTLILRAELWRDGCILRDRGQTGASLDPASVEPRRFDALRERDALPADSLEELNFARNVPAGRLLVWRDVVRRPLVRRGQVLEVIATDGVLSISLRAIALQDAGRGEAVRVRNPDSKRDFIAEVVADSRATVRF